MKKNSTIKKVFFSLLSIAIVTGTIGLSLSPEVAQAATVNTINSTGNYILDMKYNDTDNYHDMFITEDNTGAITGYGRSPSGSNAHMWEITSGSAVGNVFTVNANYTLPEEAVNPQTALMLRGIIASDGTISGTWSDNYQGGARSGEFFTTSRTALVTPQHTPGTIGTVAGTVVGGVNAGTLDVTSITTVKSTSIADGTFENGWKYIFHVTIPTNEANLAMKFSDWTNTSGSGNMPVANNIRISSAQANNNGAKVMITEASLYSVPAFHMMTDLDTTKDGIQVQVMVETATPVSSVNGNYTTTYGVRSF